jgi:urea transporter
MKMKLSLVTLGQHVGSIILATITWWAVTILIGLALFQIWPPVSFPVSGENSEGTFSIMLGVSLGQNWQNIPANFFGFIGALYAFRALCPKYKFSKSQN